ncbi:MAG: hypothetical protein HC907_05020 [Richelia sp. SM1_7_0]|nr:hypothetical protein [Richelia sp. SM1_7_0]
MALDDGYIAVIDKQSRLIQTAKTAINHEWVCQRIDLNLDDVDMKVCLDFFGNFVSCVVYNQDELFDANTNTSKFDLTNGIQSKSLVTGLITLDCNKTFLTAVSLEDIEVAVKHSMKILNPTNPLSGMELWEQIKPSDDNKCMEISEL